MQMSKKMRKALNDQMTREWQAWYTYMALAAWFKKENLDGFAAWMNGHADEEQMHAMKIHDHLFERLSYAEFGKLEQPKAEFKSPADAVEAALKHEQMVTKAIHDLVDLAREEKDKATENFLQWYVDEQVEEEAIVDDLLQRLNLVGDFKPGLFFLDRELAASGGEH